MSQQRYKYDPISSDAEPVIKAQLTENTGKHMLDSGGAYGRHWQQNQDNPPWDRPEYIIRDGYVVHNVYDYLMNNVSRSETCVAIERALHAFAYSEEYRRDGWRACITHFADAVHNHEWDIPGASDLDDETLETVYGWSDELGPEVHTWNTYNQEFHTLTQCILGHDFGDFYGEFVAVQIHNGMDVRGGYTAPRIYHKDDETLFPFEFSFNVNEVGFHQAESTVYDHADLLYQSEIDEAGLYDFLIERAAAEDIEGIPEEDIDAMVRDVAQRAIQTDYWQGGVFLHDKGGLHNVDIY